MPPKQQQHRSNASKTRRGRGSSSGGASASTGSAGSQHQQQPHHHYHHRPQHQHGSQQQQQQQQHTLSLLLDNLVASNERIQTAATQNAAAINNFSSMLGILRKENQELLQAAESNQTTLQQVKIQLQSSSEQKVSKSLLQTFVQNAERKIEEKEQMVEALQAELKASQDLVAELLASKDGNSSSPVATQEPITVETRGADDKGLDATAEQHAKEKQKKKKKAEQEKRRQQEQEAVAAMEQAEREERERQLLIKLEKQAALSRQAEQEEEERKKKEAKQEEEERKKKQQEEAEQEERKEKEEALLTSPMFMDACVEEPQVPLPESTIRTVVTVTPKSPPIRKRKMDRSVAPSRLSRYMYPKKSSVLSVSPIFELLQDPATLETARKLLRYETEMSRQKSELADLEKNKQRCTAAIAKEDKLGQSYEKQLKALDTEAKDLQGTWGKFNAALNWWDKASDEKEEAAAEKSKQENEDAPLRAKQAAARAEQARKKTRAAKAARMREITEEQKRINKLLDSIPKRIEALEAESEKWDEPIRVMQQEISDLGAKISELKGSGAKEDNHFHIDGSRNEYGHTFLMVAAQNNDIETAALCFYLGADPNVRSPHEGFTAMLFAYFFKFNEMAALIARNGGTYPQQQADAWKGVLSAGVVKAETPIDWDWTLRIAKQAAIPPETIMESADALEASDDSRMTLLTEEERKRDFRFFENSLIDPEIDMRRVALITKDVYRWFSDGDAACRSDFLSFLDSLQPEGSQKQRCICKRRAVVGFKKTYEVLCAPFMKGNKTQVALFTPFVTSAVEGVTDVGVLVWAVTSDQKASLYKTLIESTEFLRHKVDVGENFPLHKNEVLELGKDVHLLDLQSTSIFTSKPLELYILGIDQGELDQLSNEEFSPKKRIAYYEEQLNRAVFDASEQEAKDNEAILSGEQAGMSTSLFGGAGTGKTLLMTKKISSVAGERKVLVVSRLPRLVSVIKAAVERETDVTNITFSTYDDLLALLARNVTCSSELEHHGFSAFSQVQFENATESDFDTSASFVAGFVNGFLEEKERKVMKERRVAPMNLWTAFRVIKSSARCSITKQPLCREEYMELPSSFGLRVEQRTVVYDLFLRYEEWLSHGSFKWDEADRVLYILKYGPSVFSESDFVPWEKRAFVYYQDGLLEEDRKTPLYPFFYDMVFADEAQDFSELDLALLLRMSSGVRSLFLGSDPAQSVELGIRMRAGTINDVWHNSLSSDHKGIQVKSVLQEIQMRTNHRTHAQNLAMAKAVRRILARSFGVPLTQENALINGPIPEGLSLERLSDLANEDVFVGGNIVFLAPDEMTDTLRSELRKLGVQNDLFGVREAKGLEFNAVALVGFFSYIDELESGRQWENSLRWLSSRTGVTTTESSEKIQGRQLEDCDYNLSHPELLDQAMLLYTALTRARNHLYLIEVKELGASTRRKGGVPLSEFAFRRFKDLDLIKIVNFIHEGFAEMTPAQHKARGVLLVTQATSLSRSSALLSVVKEKFLEAADRFRPDKGDDKDLLDQCLKHMDAVLLKRSLVETIKKKFFDPTTGSYYDLEGRFADVLSLEQDFSKFFNMCVGDTFLADEISEIRSLMEDLFAGTPFEVRFGEICEAIKLHER